MDIIAVNDSNIEVFSKVLIEASEWVRASDTLMWKANDLKINNLLEKYKMEDMKICYDDDNLIGVYIIQWYDSLFWPELRENQSGFLHKLAICNEYHGKGYGKKLIQSAELLCREHNIEWLRLNCGTFRTRLRRFYESEGYKMLDRVYVDNRDQIRYYKKII